MTNSSADSASANFQTPAAAFQAALAKQENGDSEGALLILRELWAADSDPVVLWHICMALASLKRHAEARDLLNDSEALVISNPSLLRLRARLAQMMGDADTSLASYRALLALEPSDAVATREVLATSGDTAERQNAASSLLEICRREPRDVKSWQSLAHFAYNEFGYDAAHAILDEGIQKTDDASLILTKALTLPKLAMSHAEIERSREVMGACLERLTEGSYRIPDIIKSINRTAFHLAYHGKNDRALLERIAATHLKLAPYLAFGASQPARRMASHGKRRIGFISNFFLRHSVGKMILGVIENLPAEHFEKILIRPEGRIDEYGSRAHAFVDKTITIPVHLERARAAIAALELDILFYADIGMEPFTYYLSFSRLAPVQMTWPGHPNTSGVPTIDYYVTSSLLEGPDYRSQYSEMPLLLDRIPTFFRREEAMRLDFDPRARLNLPQGSRLYACPMSLYKFHPDFDAILGALLKADPDGKLLLLSYPGYWFDALIDRLRARIPNLLEKLLLRPFSIGRAEFLGVLKAADVLLDTIHICGANTSLEAFAYGTPIVTMDSSFLRGRWTAGMYAQMGFADLIAQDVETYVSKAVNLANDHQYRREVSDQINERSDALYSDMRVIEEFKEQLLSLKSPL